MREAKTVSTGLLLAVWAATPARAECLGDCGYGGLIAIVVGGGLAVLALIVFAMIKLGIGWLIKWIVGATVLAFVIPPIIIGAWHDHKRRVFEQRDHAGPLPMLADRTPLVIISHGLFGCPPALERYVTARAGEGVITVNLLGGDAFDFSKPVRLAELPMERRSREIETVVDSYFAEGKEVTFSEERIIEKVTPLSPAERETVASETDYLVISQCYGSGELFTAFRDIPALQAEDERFDIRLALAPIEKGSGLLSIRDLTFDLLDLWYDGETRGFLFTGRRVGGDNSMPYDPAKLEAAFCALPDGTTLKGCEE
jgi:hypothetical protein